MTTPSSNTVSLQGKAHPLPLLSLTPSQILQLAWEMLGQQQASVPPVAGQAGECFPSWALPGSPSNGAPSLRQVWDDNLTTQTGRRHRTLQEIRYIYQRLQRVAAPLLDTPLPLITPQQCRGLLQQHFSTPRQRNKAHAILHSIFQYGISQRWCCYNPLKAIRKERVQEQEITPLSWQELRQLLSTALQKEHRPCMAPLGLMLWAGVRPTEATRLHWDAIDWQEHIVTIAARHAKTGGCRHISMPPALRRWLLECPPSQGPLCPPDWNRRWQRLRRAAIATPWRQDVLRHTYASYHLKRWHNLALLQMEMGHSSQQLLQTRYLSMRGITQAHAQSFWSADYVNSLLRSKPSPPSPC